MLYILIYFIQNRFSSKLLWLYEISCPSSFVVHLGGLLQSDKVNQLT